MEMKRVKLGEQPAVGDVKKGEKSDFHLDRIHVCKQFGRKWRKIGNSLIEGGDIRKEGGGSVSSQWKEGDLTAIDLPLTREGEGERM